MQSGQYAKVSTLSLPNNKQIVPLRVITALKDGTNDLSATLNANVSLFLANHFSANGEHAIISDIGAWKEDAPVNDASVNYLYEGLKGQPTLVVVPTFTDSGNIVKLKLWSWGLGEELQYPIGLNVGWFDVDAIRRQGQISQLKEFYGILEKVGIEVSINKKETKKEAKKQEKNVAKKTTKKASKKKDEESKQVNKWKL